MIVDMIHGIEAFINGLNRAKKRKQKYFRVIFE